MGELGKARFGGAMAKAEMRTVTVDIGINETVTVYFTTPNGIGSINCKNAKTVTIQVPSGGCVWATRYGYYLHVTAVTGTVVMLLKQDKGTVYTNGVAVIN